MQQEAAPEKTENLDASIRAIYSHISELDKKGYSDLAVPLKAYLDKAENETLGQLNPLRVGYLEKITNRAYIEYLQREEKKNEVKNEQEPDVRKKTAFTIFYPGSGYMGLAQVEMNRDNKTSWRTSEFGYGYTTTAENSPDWVKFSERTPEKITSHTQYGVGSYTGSGFRNTTSTFSGKLEQWSVNVFYNYRVHENGECYSYEIIFDSPKDADDFAEYLDQKSKEKIDAEKLLPYLRDYRTLFNYNKFYLITKKYDLLNNGEGANKSKQQDIINQHQITQSDLEQAISDYQEYIKLELTRLSDPAVEAAREAKPRYNWGSLSDFYQYITKARYDALPWLMVEKTLEHYEEEIIKQAKEIAAKKIYAEPGKI